MIIPLLLLVIPLLLLMILRVLMIPLLLLITFWALAVMWELMVVMLLRVLHRGSLLRLIVRLIVRVSDPIWIFSLSSRHLEVDRRRGVERVLGGGSQVVGQTDQPTGVSRWSKTGRFDRCSTATNLADR